jgi:hypothetical protein
MSSTAIPGINKNSLWGAWKEVRQQLKRGPRRDVLDHLEYDIDPDVWIGRLLTQIKDAEYYPERPIRFSAAKAKGFNRILTLPAIPDVVLYRTIVDFLFRRAKRKQVKHAYFCQATLSKVVDEAESDARFIMATARAADDTPYSFGSKSTFLEWLRFDQYRKLLIFEKVHPFIVLTDITNFFDSILYGRIEESLYGLTAPPRLISLLFLILESLSLREAFTPVQRLGLPVDSCDCSRVLAHMILFPHDERIVEQVGEDSYVRWMDDQNIGVATRADGLRVLGTICDSLRRLHLTPNAGKSKILSLSEAKRHFHFTANALLDKIEDLPHGKRSERLVLRKAVNATWKNALRFEGEGEWQKVLKRFYRHAARAGAKSLVRRAKRDLKQFPSLVDRVSDYLRYVLPTDEVVDFVEDLIVDPEQVYPDVNFQLIEGLLKLPPNARTSHRICAMGLEILNNSRVFPGSNECKALAPLLVLRYGDRRNLRGLFTRLKRDAESLPADVTRSLCAVVGGSETAGFNVVRDTAAKLLRNHLSEFVKLVARIKQFSTVPGRFKARVALSRDSITGAEFVDMRAILAARILGLCPHVDVVVWLADTRKNHLKADITPFDRRLIARLWPTPTHGK